MKHFITFFLIAVTETPLAKAQLGVLSSLLGLVSNIDGTLFCTSKDNIAGKGAPIPVFPNAQVQLLCGGREFSNATTNDDGTFSITMDPLILDLSSLLNGCNLLVPTPLSNCNTKLPSSGSLISTLNFVGINRVGTQTIANIIPSGFHFVPPFNN